MTTSMESLSSCFVTSTAFKLSKHPINPSSLSLRLYPHRNGILKSSFLPTFSRFPRPHFIPQSTRIVASTALSNDKLQGQPLTTHSPNSEIGNKKEGSNNSKASAPKLTPDAARSAFSTLVRYFRDINTREPFIARRFGLALMCIVLSKMIGMTVPFFFKRAVDALMETGSSNTAAKITASRTARLAVISILLHGLARALASMTHELRNAVFARGGQRIGRSITATTFAHLHSLEMAFHTASRTGAVTRVVDRGTRSVMTIFRAMIFSFFPSFFELFLVCMVLFARFSGVYVVITLATFLAFTAWTLVVNDRLGRVRSFLNAAENEASAKLTDSLINVDAVKLYDNEAHETNRYDASLEKYEAIAVRNERMYAYLNVGQNIAYTTGLTALLLLATRDIVAGSMSVGSVVLLTTMLQRLWVPLDFLGWQYREVKQSLIDMQNLFDILNRSPAIRDDPQAKALTVSEGEIVFEDVTFVYPAADAALPFTSKGNVSHGNGKTNAEVSSAVPESDDESVESSYTHKKDRREIAIDRLSFSVPAGSSVALVGASGSGKSTATRLLCRLYDVTSGRILIDGQDIAKATLSSLRQAVSIVPQDTALFNDTIAYNIRYGRPSATDEEVVGAAKAASIHDVIMRTEHGYDTVVGERGVRLSGGERQRLSVARAFLKGSRIIVEDESTSALDTLTELEVSKALKDLGVNRTRIIVAHRLSTINHVDQVVVMKNGRKVEQGTINNLLRKPNGLFRAMWERQQRKDNENDQAEEDVLEDSSDSKQERHELSEEDKRLEEARQRRGDDGMFGMWESARDG